MSRSRARVGISADTYVAVVRAYADRVHDDVRRLGCSPPAAAEVVESSALGLAEKLRSRPQEVPDLVGAWFRDARIAAARVAGRTRAEDLATGEGIVQSSEDDASARRALAELGERERVALLLRDAYDLPYLSVGVAMTLEPDEVAVLVARARLAFLRLVTGSGPADPAPGHEAQLATAARLADGQLAPEGVTHAERHARRCPICREVLPAQRDARRILTGLAIIAMADTDRDALIARAAAVGQRGLPSADEVAAAGDGSIRRLLPVPLVAACLGGALVLGVLVALATDSGGANNAAPPFDPNHPSATSSLSATPSATASASSTATGSPAPTASQSSRPPRTSASASATFSGYPGSERIALSRSSGPNTTTIQVTGTGWITGKTVHIEYLNPLRRPTGQEATAIPDSRGRFTATIVCYDPAEIPGPHTIRATNAYGQSQEATYTAT